MCLNRNARTLRWYADTSKVYTGFYCVLATEIAPSLAGCRSLCDLGCSLALFDFEIAPLLNSIGCADISEAAPSYVTDRAQALGLCNISPVLTDCKSLSVYWDAIFMSLFGVVIWIVACLCAKG